MCQQPRGRDQSPGTCGRSGELPGPRPGPPCHFPKHVGKFSSHKPANLAAPCSERQVPSLNPRKSRDQDARLSSEPGLRSRPPACSPVPFLTLTLVALLHCAFY